MKPPFNCEHHVVLFQAPKGDSEYKILEGEMKSPHSDQHLVNEDDLLLMIQSWSWGSQVADEKMYIFL